MKIYKVRIEWETVIRAKDEDHAIKQAERIIRTGDDEPDCFIAKKISSQMELPEGWNAKCRPWGETDPYDKTLGEILPIANAEDKN